MLSNAVFLVAFGLAGAVNAASSNVTSSSTRFETSLSQVFQAPSSASSSSRTVASAKSKQARSLPLSVDGTCGATAGTICGPTDCCSQFGFCDNTPAHCGSGCQAGFGKCDSPAAPPAGQRPPSTDGRCGAGFGTTCSATDCCSQFGFCDNTPVHCGTGCQAGFGKCDSVTAPPPIGPPPPPPVVNPPSSRPPSTDGRCGAGFGTTCGATDCCSQFGFCDNTPVHCGSGCQAGFGKCNSVTAPPPSGAIMPAIDPSKKAKIIETCTQPRMFALTFDDGPSYNTGTVLDALKANKVKATFFVNSLNFGDLTTEPSRGFLLRAFKEGHQIASHTFSHADLTKLSSQGIFDEMNKNDDTIAGIIGKRPVHMRPPFLATNDNVLTALGSFGYRVIGVNLDSKDFEHLDSDAIQRNTDSYNAALQGKPLPQTSLISLQHDHVPSSAQWIGVVVKRFSALGYRFVTVGECLGDSKIYR